MIKLSILYAIISYPGDMWMKEHLNTGMVVNFYSNSILIMHNEVQKTS